MSEEDIISLPREDLEWQIRLQQQYIGELLDKIDDVYKIIKKHTTSFKDVFVPASESWKLYELLGDKENEQER